MEDERTCAGMGERLTPLPEQHILWHMALSPSSLMGVEEVIRGGETGGLEFAELSVLSVR